jgi:hypothetical protein
MRRPLNTRFIVRFLIAFLALTVVTLTALSFLPPPMLRQLVVWAQVLAAPPPEATPLPPVIIAPQGQLPAGPVAVEEWKQYAGGDYEIAGSGFFLRLSDGTIVGVTTAHSVGNIADPANTLEHIAFKLAGGDHYLAVFDTLHGPPGIPREGAEFNLTVDYVLLRVPVPDTVEPSLILEPDSRGAPQPGERVSLFSGLGGESGPRRELGGVVQSVEATSVWVLMDDVFDAGGMSGSPLLSQHTGLVVGMAIAVDYDRNRVRIGFHPIGSIVEKAQAATVFSKINEYP